MHMEMACGKADSPSVTAAEDAAFVPGADGIAVVGAGTVLAGLLGDDLSFVEMAGLVSHALPRPVGRFRLVETARVGLSAGQDPVEGTAILVGAQSGPKIATSEDIVESISPGTADAAVFTRLTHGKKQGFLFGPRRNRTGTTGWRLCCNLG